MFTGLKHSMPTLLAAILVVSSSCAVGDETGDQQPTDEQVDESVSTSALGGRGSCVVKVNGVVVKNLSARDRNDCYAKTSFGSAQCQAYAPHLRFGITNVIQQVFNGTDQVNRDTCVLPPTCVVKVRGVVVSTISAPDRATCYNRTSFGSDNCATYAPYFTTGNNLLEQYFAGTDRVNSQTCLK